MLYLYRWGLVAYVAPMEMAAWLAREAERDEAQGLPPSVSDPTALRLLALAATLARKQAPTLPQDGR